MLLGNGWVDLHESGKRQDVGARYEQRLAVSELVGQGPAV
jgi:hypothetical protein